MPRIGLIQTFGIGDIIIALPIADFFLEQGCEVVWPIHSGYVKSFQDVKPEVQFIGVEEREGCTYDTPLQLLQGAKCDRIITLYSSLKGRSVTDEQLSRSLKLDEYKYAIAGVPFARKWDLKLRRNMPREMALYEKLQINGPYICSHLSGSQKSLGAKLPESFTNGLRVIEVTELTDSPFDWIYTLEHAQKLLLIDSCFANLVDQLRIPVEKFLIFISEIQFTPVFASGWNYIRARP